MICNDKVEGMYITYSLLSKLCMYVGLLEIIVYVCRIIRGVKVVGVDGQLRSWQNSAPFMC